MNEPNEKKKKFSSLHCISSFHFSFAAKKMISINQIKEKIIAIEKQKKNRKLNAIIKLELPRDPQTNQQTPTQFSIFSLVFFSSKSLLW